MNSPLNVIAHIESDFPAKFGIPRQSGMVDALAARVVFTPAYRNPDAVRGLEDFSHIWLIWGFSAVPDKPWSPTVRPPRLGGNRRMGVFATRSPFRPNAIGLSSVELRRVEQHPALGPVLHVAGADLMDATPIYDIKPYLPYTDCHLDALGGFAAEHARTLLTVEIPPVLFARIPPERQEALTGVLAQDPRPSYQSDPERVYGMPFGGWDVKFTVKDGKLTVTDICVR